MNKLEKSLNLILKKTSAHNNNSYTIISSNIAASPSDGKPISLPVDMSQSAGNNLRASEAPRFVRQIIWAFPFEILKVFRPCF